METGIAALVGATFGIVLVLLFSVAKSRDSVERLDQKVNILLEQANVELTEIACQKARANLQQGDKIAAIQVYRQLTGASLAEAKTAVENLEQPA